jgi:hypothetical protein
MRSVRVHECSNVLLTGHTGRHCWPRTVAITDLQRPEMLL